VRTAAILGKEVPWLAKLITNVSEEANSAIDGGKKVLVEGTQGFGLSLYHSDNYPKTTSRDTTAAGFLSEVGLSPRLVTEIVLVLRTFPIRVAGEQAGPLKDEITWEDLQRESGCPQPVEEMTTVTKKLRRVGRFDWELANSAVKVNRATSIAINGLDYLNFKNRNVEYSNSLTREAAEFLQRLEGSLGVPARFCGTGPALKQLFVKCTGSCCLLEAV
jgi:adenylosuccinate synthase